VTESGTTAGPVGIRSVHGIAGVDDVSRYLSPTRWKTDALYDLRVNRTDSARHRVGLVVRRLTSE
jgi:hypothetical protein